MTQTVEMLALLLLTIPMEEESRLHAFLNQQEIKRDILVVTKEKACFRKLKETRTKELRRKLQG